MKARGKGAKAFSCANWKSEFFIGGVQAGQKIPFLWPVMSEEAWTTVHFK